MPTLLLMAGLPGAGKSTLALALGRALSWPVLDKDLVEGALRAATPPVVAPTALAYDATFTLLADLLGPQGQSVILDSPATNPAQVARAERIADACGARVRAVLCVADRGTRNARMVREVPPTDRAWRHPARRVPSTVAGDGRDQFNHLPLDATLIVETTRSQEAIVAEVVAWLN